jgi:acyl carrier protein
MTYADLETEIKQVIVSSLRLDDIQPAAIVTTDPLFGEGLGLDSIDALELATALEGHFGVKFTPAAMDVRAVFKSVATLAEFIGNARGLKP